MEKKNFTKRILLTIGSMFVCLMIMGVSVYAALSQTVEITNSISVNTSGQAKALVSVYEEKITGEKAVTEVGDEPTWGEAVLTKSSSQDNASQELEGIIFSQTEKVNMYAYKFYAKNESTTNTSVDVTITSSVESNTEIDIWVGEDYETLTKLENGQGVNFKKEDLAANGEVVYYVVITANTDLANMAEMSSQDFNFNVVVSV